MFIYLKIKLFCIPSNSPASHQMVITMGSAHDIMQTFASKDLHAQFPDYEGWVWSVLPTAGSRGILYRVSRYYHGQPQEAFLTVSFEPQPLGESVLALSSVKPEYGCKTSRCLLVPKGTDVSGIPTGIRILSMSSFGYVDGSLVWLTKKKNAIRYPIKESAAA